MDRIDILLRGPIDDLEEERFAGYIETVWRAAAQQGWVDLAALDARMAALEDFSIPIPADAASEALALLHRALDDPQLPMYVTVRHVVGGADG